MITFIRRLVYFGGLFVAVMAIILIMIKDEMGYVPEYLRLSMLSLIFVLGILLAILIKKRGIGG